MEASPLCTCSRAQSSLERKRRGVLSKTHLPNTFGRDVSLGGGCRLDGQRHRAEGGAQQQDQVARPEQVRVVHQPRVQQQQHPREHHPVRHMVHGLKKIMKKMHS